MVNKIIMKNQKGFTLIELLITMFILSMLMFTGTFVYSMLMERWGKELGDFNLSSREAKHLNLLQSSLCSIYPHIIVDSKRKPSFFFIGGKDSLLSVTRSGLFDEKGSEFFRLTTLAKEDGIFDLVYQSKSSNDLFLIGTEQAVEFTDELLLFSDLTKVEFNYFGWDSYFKKAGETKGNGKWFDDFSGIDNQLMPEKIELTLFKAQSSVVLTCAYDSESFRWLSPYLDEDQ